MLMQNGTFVIRNYNEIVRFSGLCYSWILLCFLVIVRRETAGSHIVFGEYDVHVNLGLKCVHFDKEL